MVANFLPHPELTRASAPPIMAKTNYMAKEMAMSTVSQPDGIMQLAHAY